jgi:hypothetical protein
MDCAGRRRDVLGSVTAAPYHSGNAVCIARHHTLVVQGKVQHYTTIDAVARMAPVNYIDETSWRIHGDRYWLWGMANWAGKRAKAPQIACHPGPCIIRT